MNLSKSMIAELSGTNLYRLTLRPAGFSTIPQGVEWEFVEAPPDLVHLRRDLPVSKYPYGMIRTSRPLTPNEMKRFDIVKVGG